MWGDAGVGKSHLLSRLARWAHRDGKACFVYLQNLQPDPENLPRSLLRVTVSILTRGRQDQFHDTPLFRLVQAAVRNRPAADARPRPRSEPTPACSTASTPRRPAQPAFVDRTIYEVLFRFLRLGSAARRRTPTTASRPWRSAGCPATRSTPKRPGDSACRRSGTATRPSALADDQQIKLVLVALSQMALFAAAALAAVLRSGGERRKRPDRRLVALLCRPCLTARPICWS